MFLRPQLISLKPFLRALTLLAGPGFHLILAVMLLCPYMSDWSNSFKIDATAAEVDASLIKCGQQMPTLVYFRCEGFLEASCFRSYA